MIDRCRDLADRRSLRGRRHGHVDGLIFAGPAERGGSAACSWYRTRNDSSAIGAAMYPPSSDSTSSSPACASAVDWNDPRGSSCSARSSQRRSGAATSSLPPEHGRLPRRGQQLRKRIEFVGAKRAAQHERERHAPDLDDVGARYRDGTGRPAYGGAMMRRSRQSSLRERRICSTAGPRRAP